MEEDDYNVSNYTDNELYDILELVNPSDSVLEAKILQMINTYKSVTSDYGKKITIFFMNIYQRFFDVPSEHFETIEEGYTNIRSSIYDNSNNKFIDVSNDEIAYETDITGTNNVNLYRENVNSNLPSTFNNVRSIQDTSTKIWNPLDSKVKEIQDNPNLQIGFKQKDNAQALNQYSSMQVQQLDYSKGTLNPLLKQTIKRIISIDSQYRETKDNLSTEFTFNLSEPLRDVVALRLYSIQIPFTWYTIGNNYGANYIYLKGNSPGIDNGNFDYKIEIDPGNYTNDTLVKEIHDKIPDLKSNNTDISFGTTDITYNSTTCKSTFNIDIKNLYNESDYNLIFPVDPSLNKYPLESDTDNNNPNDELRYNTSKATSTLSAYLGFDNQSYKINTIFSDPNTDNLYDSSTKTYSINSSNNSFIISRKYENGTKINDDIEIQIQLEEGAYNGNRIVGAINDTLEIHPRLVNSSITRKKVVDSKKGPSYKYSNGKYYYELTIHFNKTTDRYANVPNLTTYITFPDENTIWTGTNSLFKFKSREEYTNVIIAESESHQTDYPINSNPYIVLKCVKPGFDTSYNYAPTGNTHPNPHPLSNDFIIDISNSTNTIGYNFTSYINEIHTKIQSLNTSTKQYDYSFFNNDISYNSGENKVFFKFDINIKFDQNSYEIEFGDVFTTLGFSVIQDINAELSSIAVNLDSYTFSPGNILATIYPKSNKANRNDLAWKITYRENNTNSYGNISDLKNVIEDAFNNFIIPGTQDTKPITLNFTYNDSYNENNISKRPIFLNFTISQTLSERDYDVYLYDASLNSQESSWNKNLFFDPYYTLVVGSSNVYIDNTNNYVTVKSNQQIAGYTFYMDKETTFTLSAITNGAYSSGGENNVVITIPKPLSGNLYTRQEIINIINNQLTLNPLSTGSKIEHFNIEGTTTNVQYIRLKIKINKMFTASDYKLVFYDQLSFVRCFVGTKSVRNVTWDSTLGWTLGFRSYTEYEFNNKIAYSSNVYSNTSNIVTLTSDTTMTTNIYDYFLIILDDYTQSHLNDGLVTIIPKDMLIKLPSYAKTQSCVTGEIIVTDSSGTKMTGNQLYAANAILNQKKLKKKNYSTGPYIQDVFGLIPLKLGIAAGQTYVEFGGTLQNQERVYFGPVNISRMTIKLINDRGEPVDLNGANWSFSFICEQIYNLNDRSH